MEFTKAEIKGKKEGNVRTFQISDQTVDRDKEIIVIDGVGLSKFRKNPIIMYAHSANWIPNPDLVIGRSPKIWTEDMDSLPKLFGDGQFDVAGAEDLKNVLAAKVLYKLDNKFLNTTSIGFGSDRESRGYGSKEAGEDPKIYYHRKTELHEWSVVPVPANPNATIQRAFQKGLMHNLEEWYDFLQKENFKGDDLNHFIRGDVEDAPGLLFLDPINYKAPDNITFVIGGAKESTKEEVEIKSSFLYRQARIRQSKI